MKKKEHSIPLADIVSVADRDLGDIERLAKSIKEVGLLQPILLKPGERGKFEVVDGRRRFCAIVKLRWEELPPGSYALRETEEDAALVAHVANTERKPLKPSEELAQLDELAQHHTTEELAARLGRSPGWIARRLKIRDLSEEWRKVLDDPELAAMWPLEKLALIARQPRHIQKELEYMVEDGVSYTVKEIEEEIADLTNALSAAIFDRGPCSKCVNNSSLQQFLFDDVGEGCCLDPKCYKRKTVEALKAKLAARPELTPVVSGGDLAEFFPKAVHLYDVIDSREPGIGDTPNALMVSGDQVGRELVVRFRSKTAADTARKTAAQEAAEAETQAKKGPTLEEREEVLAQKRNRRALELLADYLQRKYKGKAWAEAVPNNQKFDHFLNTVRLYGFTGDFTHDFRCQLTRKQVIPSTDRLFEAVYDQARRRLAQNLIAEARDTLADISREAGDAVAELCCIIPQWIEIKKQAALEVPEPKSLIEARKKEAGK